MALNINGTTGISGVDGSVSAPAVTGTDSNTGITFPSADTIKFSTAGVERMAITNSGVSGITAGITMADSWRITSHYTMTGTNLIQQLTANWERSDTAAFTGIGSPMTESSGNFNFPQTGIYLVRFHMQAQATGGGLQAIGAMIRFKKGASGSFTTQCQSQDSGTANYYGSAMAEAIIDVTDAANDQVAFVVQGTASRQILGNSDYARTGVIFIRLGDT